MRSATLRAAAGPRIVDGSGAVRVAVGLLLVLLAGCGADASPGPGPGPTATGVLLIGFGLLDLGALVTAVVAGFRAGRRPLLLLAIISWVLLLAHVIGTAVLVAGAPGSAGALPLYARAVVALSVLPVVAAAAVTSLALVHDVSRRPRRWITPVVVVLVGAGHGAAVVSFVLAHAPLAVLSQAPMVDVRIGEEHGCALHQDGAVSCWGANGDGQLGDGSRREVQWPVAVWGLYDAVTIAVGNGHSCARRRDGSVVCWGRDSETGEVSAMPHVVLPRASAGPWIAGSRVFAVDGSGVAVSGRGPSQTLEPLVPLPPIEQLAPGLRHVCARLGDGAIECWGDGKRGQLGTAVSFGRDAPVEPSDEERLDLSDRIGVRAIAGSQMIVAGHHHTCALRTDGTVACWGARDEGDSACRDGCASSGPADVAGLSDAAMISAGAQHTCALRASGGVLCWGDNRWGQLGNGTLAAVRGPVEVVLPRPAFGVYANGFSTCAALQGGEVYCWGASRNGSLGVQELQDCRARKILPSNECALRPTALRWAERP